MSLGNWPEAGVTPDPLLTPRRMSNNWMKGGHVLREFTVRPKETNLWPILVAFAGAVLGDAGYVDFEGALDKLTKESVAAADATDPAKVPSVAP